MWVITGSEPGKYIDPINGRSIEINT